DLVGEMSLIDGEVRAATVDAMTPTLTLAISRADFNKILENNPKFTKKLLINLSKRLRSNDKFLELTLSGDLYYRTEKTLETLSPYFLNNEIALSQEEL